LPDNVAGVRRAESDAGSITRKRRYNQCDQCRCNPSKRKCETLTGTNKCTVCVRMDEPCTRNMLDFRNKNTKESVIQQMDGLRAENEDLRRQNGELNVELDRLRTELGNLQAMVTQLGASQSMVAGGHTLGDAPPTMDANRVTQAGLTLPSPATGTRSHLFTSGFEPASPPLRVSDGDVTSAEGGTASRALNVFAFSTSPSLRQFSPSDIGVQPIHPMANPADGTRRAVSAIIASRFVQTSTTGFDSTSSTAHRRAFSDPTVTGPRPLLEGGGPWTNPFSHQRSMLISPHTSYSSAPEGSLPATAAEMNPRIEADKVFSDSYDMGHNDLSHL